MTARRASLLADVPAALVVALGGLIGVLVAAGSFGWRPLADPWACRALAAAWLAAVPVVTAGLARGRRGGDDPAPSASAWWVPGLMVLVYLASALLPPAQRLAWFLQSGDNVRHVFFVAQLADLGALTYDEEAAYPRGWHGLLAAAWGSLGDEPRDDGLGSLLETTAAATWILFVVLAAATGLLAGSFARSTGLRGRAVVGASVLGSTLPWVPSLSVTTLVPGFQTTLVAALVLAVALRELIEYGDRLRGVVVVAACGIVVSHTWQILLPVVGLAGLLCLVRLLRRDDSPVRWLGAGATVLLAAAVSLPGVLIVVSTVGPEHATAPSDLPVPSPWWALAVLAASAWLLPRTGPGKGARAALGLVALPAVTGVALAVGSGVALGAYYPAKTLAHTSLLGLAPVSAGVVLLAAAAAAAGRRALAAVVGGLAATVGVAALVVSAALPTGALTRDAPVDAGLVLAAMRSAGVADSEAFWVGRPLETAVVRALSYSFDPAGADVDLANDYTVLQECAELAAAVEPAVVSSRPVGPTQERYACVPDVVVWEVPTG